MTAAAAGIHVSVRVAGDAAAAAGGDDPWADLARRVGVRVDGLDQQRVSRTASALGLVAIYSAFDAFVRELRGDWHALAGAEWQQFKGDTPLQEIRRNAPNGLDVGGDGNRSLSTIGDVETGLSIRLKRRCAKRSVLRAQATSLSGARAAWEQIGTCSAPNGPESLEFDDLKFFARVGLHVGESSPTPSIQGTRLLPVRSPCHLVARCPDPVRLRRRATGFLQTEWGLTKSRAERSPRLQLRPPSLMAALPSGTHERLVGC